MKIEIRNDLLIRDAPRSFLSVVMQRLTIPNPALAEAERMGRWTGNLEPHLYGYTLTERGELSVPRGFGRQLHTLARQHGLAPEYTDLRRVLEPISCTFKGTLRPYQKRALESILERDFGVLEAGTGSGKTVTGAAVIAARKQPTLVLVHTKELLNQWCDRIEQFLGIEAGRLGGGQFEIRPVAVGTVQTARKHLTELVPRFGQLVVDECHRTPSTTFLECVSAFDCKFLLGLTATPYRRDGLSSLIFWALGGVIHKVDRAHLRKTGAIMEPEIVPVKTSYRFWGDPSRQYSKMISHLTQDQDRNRLIVSTVLQELKGQEGTLLMLSDRKDHLERLAALLINHGQPTAVLTGQTHWKRREGIVRDLSAGRIRLLASTTSLLGEGFDCPGLAVLFLCSPIKFKGRLIQVAGRILRPQKGKRPRIIDFVDCEEPVLMASYKSRQSAYKQLAP